MAPKEYAPDVSEVQYTLQFQACAALNFGELIDKHAIAALSSKQIGRVKVPVPMKAPIRE
eukprot:scaffold111353_cov19-Tisochrysis_lutea.AAC.2